MYKKCWYILLKSVLHYIFRCEFDVKMFAEMLSESMTLYDQKQMLLSFDESSFYYAIKEKVVPSAEVCKVVYPDIDTWGDHAICPSPSHHTGGSVKYYSQGIVTLMFAAFLIYFNSWG